jgi:hypothetical protein
VSSALPFLGIGIVIALMIATAVLTQVHRRRRRREFTAWAAQHGFSYAGRDKQWAKLEQWGRPFNTGSRRRATDVLIGRHRGHPVVAFTYQYTVSSSGAGGTTDTRTHVHSVYAVGLPRTFPMLRVGRENLATKLARTLGWNDIRFESEHFNRAFAVESVDRRLASDVLHPRLMQWLLDTDAPGFMIVQDRLVLVQPKQLPLDQLERRLDYVTEVADQIPAFVLTPVD